NAPKTRPRTAASGSAPASTTSAAAASRMPRPTSTSRIVSGAKRITASAHEGRITGGVSSAGVIGATSLIKAGGRLPAREDVAADLGVLPFDGIVQRQGPGVTPEAVEALRARGRAGAHQ